MEWTDYDGQSVEGYQAIGTDEVNFPITEGMDVAATVAEVKRVCGKFARIKLFREGEK